MVLAFGFSLAIMGSGASYTVLAMEQPCISPEIVESHKLVAKEMKSLNVLSDCWKPGASPILSPDFLIMNPLDMLYHLQHAMDWLFIQLQQIQDDRGRVPGTLSPCAYVQYKANRSLLKKVYNLFVLIKNSCDITDAQIKKINKQLDEQRRLEFEFNGLIL